MTRPIDNALATQIAIDRKADVPVGVQLDWGLCAQIRDGSLTPGQQLPTLREMAESTGLNANTVRAVYRRLEQRGLIESQQGSGTFVAATPHAAAALSSIAANAANEARETGLDPREVAAALYVAPEEGRNPSGASSPTPTERTEADRRRALRTQIAALERTLGELEAEHPGVAPASAARRRGIGPALLTVEELGQIRGALIRRLTLVQAAIDSHVEGQRRQDAQAGVPATATARQPASRKQAKPKSKAVGASKRGPQPRPTSRPAPAGG
ncbi:MAG TPA: GntR family transcriptional regulator [Solirubrobacteraceae bacterium]|nr:GntR family transcriptional regulator [Solirubrobacteraceae bacterium]